MNITPHLVIESMIKLKDQPMWRSPKALKPLAQLMNQAVLFNFGTTRPPTEHMDFALDLYERGLFTLPFPVTAFGFTATTSEQASAGASYAASGMMTLSMNDDGTLTAVQSMEMRYTDERAAKLAVPQSAIYHASFKNVRNGEVDVTVDEALPILTDHMMAATYGPKWRQVLKERVSSNMIRCMGMTVMLMSKGVVTEHHPAPDKLNKARVKKKKPMIRDSYTVRINLDAIRTIHTEEGDEDITGHTRKSPRPHWRRGHFRTIHRDGESRVIPVAPSLVASHEGEVAKRIYDVAKRGA